MLTWDERKLPTLTKRKDTPKLHCIMSADDLLSSSTYRSQPECQYGGRTYCTQSLVQMLSYLLSPSKPPPNIHLSWILSFPLLFMHINKYLAGWNWLGAGVLKIMVLCVLWWHNYSFVTESWVNPLTLEDQYPLQHSIPSEREWTWPLATR